MELIIPDNSPTYKQLVGFQICGHYTLFFMSIDTIADIANATMNDRHTAPLQPLEGLADEPALEERVTDIENYKQWTRTPLSSRPMTWPR